MKLAQAPAFIFPQQRRSLLNYEYEFENMYPSLYYFEIFKFRALALISPAEEKYLRFKFKKLFTRPGVDPRVAHVCELCREICRVHCDVVDVVGLPTEDVVWEDVAEDLLRKTRPFPA